MNFDVEKKIEHIRSEFAADGLTLAFEDGCPSDLDHTESVWYNGTLATISAEVDGKLYTIELCTAGSTNLASAYWAYCEEIESQEAFESNLKELKKLCKDDDALLALIQSPAVKGTINYLAYRIVDAQGRKLTPLHDVETEMFTNIIDSLEHHTGYWKSIILRYAQNLHTLELLMDHIADTHSCACKLENDRTTVLLETSSPAGQDVFCEISFDGDVEQYAQDLLMSADEYDPDEEATYWIDSSGHGINGAPYHLSDILEDMKWAKQFFTDAASTARNFLRNLKKQEEKSDE